MALVSGSRINPRRFDISQLKFYVILCVLAGFLLLPIIFMFSQALKPLDELFLYPPEFFVHHPTLQNFRELFAQTSITAVPMTRYLFNSIVVAATVVFATSVISAMAGYALSKLDFKLKKFIFEANILALMFVPAAVGIPRYFIISKLGITNNLLGHIIPLLAVPVNVFLVKQFVDQIPDSLLEAAYMDGANQFQVFSRIILPLIRPALATVAILAFQTAWNSTESSTLYVNVESLKTFAFYMSTLASNVGNQVAGQGIAAAAALLMFIPNLIIFIVMQSKVMDTMAHSGLK
ncbi:MAG: carbohydrate ABC transporter permease [Alicyclobacillus sp.]|nr:carbohydrate ABC transporter permease [Alicyclobacillus sp.]